MPSILEGYSFRGEYLAIKGRSLAFSNYSSAKTTMDKF